MPERKLELPEGIPPLNTYYVYLTAGCNLACQHCWLAPKYQANGSTGGHLDYDLFALALEQGLPLGLSSIKLTGGEPLLHPDFLRIVDLIKERELGLTIETNGVLLTRELARYLKENSTLGHISVSIDGAAAETHDAFRGVNGSFEKATNAVRYLGEVGYRPQVIMSIHAGNVDEIEPLVRLAESLGSGSVKFNLIQPTGRGETMIGRNQVIGVEQLIALGQWVEGDLQSRYNVTLSYSWPTAFHSIGRLLRNPNEGCGIFNILGILSTGHLAMCGIGTHVPELCYGTLGIDCVADSWCRHPMLQSLRSELPDKLGGVCANCLVRKQCLGSCVANNYHQSGHLTESFWFCQQAAAKNLFPVSRMF